MPIWRTTEQIAELFNVTPRHIRQLAKDELIPAKKTADGYKFDLEPTVRMFMKVRSSPDLKEDEGLSDNQRKAKADADWKTARAAIAKLELAELNGNVHRSEDVAEAFEDFAMTVRAAFLALPGRLAVDTANAQTAMETSSLIQEVVNDTLNSLANYQYDSEFYKQKVREREGWRERDEDDG